jgi:hypothetical protein
MGAARLPVRECHRVHSMECTHRSVPACFCNEATGRGVCLFAAARAASNAENSKSALPSTQPRAAADTRPALGRTSSQRLESASTSSAAATSERAGAAAGTAAAAMRKDGLNQTLFDELQQMVGADGSTRASDRPSPSLQHRGRPSPPASSPQSAAHSLSPTERDLGHLSAAGSALPWRSGSAEPSPAMDSARSSESARRSSGGASSSPNSASSSGGPLAPSGALAASERQRILQDRLDLYADLD